MSGAGDVLTRKLKSMWCEAGASFYEWSIALVGMPEVWMSQREPEGTVRYLTSCKQIHLSLAQNPPSTSPPRDEASISRAGKGTATLAALETPKGCDEPLSTGTFPGGRNWEKSSLETAAPRKTHTGLADRFHESTEERGAPCNAAYPTLPQRGLPS